GSTTIQATSGAISGSTTLTVSAGFVLTGSLNIPREYQTATALDNGMVLIAGGNSSSAAELYNQVTGSFTVTGNLNTPRSLHSATLLDNGRVLIFGGVEDTNA